MRTRPGMLGVFGAGCERFWGFLIVYYHNIFKSWCASLHMHTKHVFVIYA